MKRKGQKWIKHLDFIAWDILCLEVAFALAYGVRFGWHLLTNLPQDYVNMAAGLLVVDVLVSAIFNTMHNVRKRGYGLELAASFRHVCLVFSALTCFMFLFHITQAYSRIFVFVMMALHGVLGYAVRLVWKKVLPSFPQKDDNQRMLVVASSSHVMQVLAQLGALGKDSSLVDELILTDEGDIPEPVSCPVVARIGTAVEYICHNWVDEVFIAPDNHSPQVQHLADECRKMGVTIHEGIALNDSLGNRQFLQKIGEYQVVTSSVNLPSPLQLACKRMIDILAGLAGLAATGVILLFVAPKMKKASPGPLFFRQDRVGMNGRVFKFVKIRSMYLDAEERKKELMAQNRVADGMMFKMDFDPRIIGNEVLPDGTRKTGIGQFIRSTSLDVFPQFWNVLKGDMSLVGTRPPTVDEWEKYDPHHRARLAMKPGITGLWQVSGRSEITDFEEVVRLDTDYIYNWSLMLDFKIIFKTFGVLFQKKGAM